MKIIRNCNREITEIIARIMRNKCVHCGSVKNLCIHHIVPVSRGGINRIDNVCLLCRDCHSLFHLKRNKQIITAVNYSIMRWKKKFWKSIRKREFFNLVDIDEYYTKRNVKVKVYING